jgi:hypothetical protein
MSQWNHPGLIIHANKKKKESLPSQEITEPESSC